MCWSTSRQNAVEIINERKLKTNVKKSILEGNLPYVFEGEGYTLGTGEERPGGLLKMLNSEPSYSYTGHGGSCLYMQESGSCELCPQLTRTLWKDAVSLFNVQKRLGFSLDFI